MIEVVLVSMGLPCHECSWTPEHSYWTKLGEGCNCRAKIMNLTGRCETSKLHHEASPLRKSHCYRNF